MITSINNSHSFANREYPEIASHGFIHIDLIGDTYMCYVLSRTTKLQLTRLKKSNDSSETQIFGMTTSIPAKDAVCLNVFSISI